MAQAGPSQNHNIKEDFRQNKVQEVVRYLLMSLQKKIPIKRADIVKNVLKDSAKEYTSIMKEAKEQLFEVFGMELNELEDKKQKSYIVTNCLEVDTDEPHIEWSPEDNSRMGLVMIILSLIFMNGNTMVDSALYSVLGHMGIDVESKTHKVFGDVKKLISQDFVRMGYLTYTRQVHQDTPTYDVTWGPRTKLETTKSSVLQFVCEIHKVEPQSWKTQWKDAQREQQEAETDE